MKKQSRKSDAIITDEPKPDAKPVKENHARHTALMERRIGASLNSIALAFAASRPKTSGK